MRVRFLAPLCAVALLLVGEMAAAQSLPGPDNRPAPGNEVPALTPREAGYRPQVNYQLECSGCHHVDGEGSRANDVPRMKDFVGHFLDVEGGRAFLVQVPGVSLSSFTDAQLADLLNWMLTSDIAGDSTPVDFVPYTASEVATLRAEPLERIDVRRNVLLERMRAKRIAIRDGLGDRP
ncbi:cytochrome C [Salinisphaera sp. S4-8]|uniref:cytochrome C n=1 Tax=Salinisphaera sp. S4-8 TaxID=633357 RepID=UPI00333E478D